jgi:hypothetical protein
MSAFDERLEKPSSTSADAPPPPPSRRSICTQHIEVRRGGVHGMCGSRAPSRAAPERAPKTDPHVERCRRGRRAQLLLLRRSASLVACRAARARSGQARGGPSLRAQIPGFNVISGDYPGFEGSTVMADPPPPSQPAFTGPGRRGDCSPGALLHCRSSSTAGPRRLDPEHSRGAARVSQPGSHQGSWWPVQATSSPWHKCSGSKPCASSLSRDVLRTHGRFRTSPSRPEHLPEWISSLGR